MKIAGRGIMGRMYLVVEGQDGSGKSTQVAKLADYFRGQGREVVVLEEPDGDLPQAHDLHDMILRRGYDLEALTNVLLFTAARVELWRKIAAPALSRGAVVVASRNYWSTLAYQGYGEGVSHAKIIRLTKAMLPQRYFQPDHGFILLTGQKERLARQANRGQAAETFEQRPAEFQQKVDAAYPKIAKDFGATVIDASGSIEEIFGEILKALGERAAE